MLAWEHLGVACGRDACVWRCLGTGLVNYCAQWRMCVMVRGQDDGEAAMGESARCIVCSTVRAGRVCVEAAAALLQCARWLCYAAGNAACSMYAVSYRI
jgi:hypothetical protein